MHSAKCLPILLYYRFRGQLQPVRNLFCYLNIPFLEIHLERWQQQKNYLTQEVLNIIGQFKIDKTQVPSLIYGDILINGALPIMTFICKVQNHIQLLGSNIRIRSKLLEIMEIYTTKQPQSMIQFFKFSEFAYDEKRTQQQINQYGKNAYQGIMDDSKYIRQICQYLDKQQGNKYVLGQLTLVDFFFMQTCVYMLGCFQDKDRVYSQLFQKSSQQSFTQLNKPNSYYISIMKNFKQSMKGQYFYRQYRDYLESFSIISIFTSQEKAVGLKKTWLGNPKLIL